MSGNPWTASGHELDAWAALLELREREPGETDASLRGRLIAAFMPPQGQSVDFLRALYWSETLAGAMVVCQRYGVDPSKIRVDFSDDTVWVEP
jgi:hypothetical protein